MRARRAAPFLWLYERISRRGLLDQPLARRAFESAYLAYKLIEAGPVSRLRSFAAPGSTVIDVGANIGFFTLRFARWVGPRGRVIAIEPEGHNVASLRRRIARARLESIVECVEAVAADTPGEMRLALNPVHPGDHRIAAEGEQVRAVTIDELTADFARKVSLVKIDVQGAEMLVISGARAVLAAHRPALFVEVDDVALGQFESSAEELIRTVADLGYSAHTLTRHGISPPRDSESLVAKSAGGAYSDVLFLPRA
jgi:FkbM family methyltransferase